MDGFTSLEIHRYGELDDLDPGIPRGRITEARLIRDATAKHKSIVVLRVEMDGFVVYAETTLALFHSTDSAFRPQWGAEVGL